MVQVLNGSVFRIDTDAANRSPRDIIQFDGLKGHLVVATLKKLAELELGRDRNRTIVRRSCLSIPSKPM